jgi:eukaryotic-like serine/threonine-protein kinase
MKYCPQCGGSYPSDFHVCPKDETVLQIASELAPGMVIRNKWVILDKIGSGGMATVYRARHQAFGTIRAIKVINAHHAEDAAFRKRFHAEAVLAQKLQHPNVIHIDDLDATEDGRPFIVMEYIPCDLRRTIAQQGVVPLARALSITAQVGSALEAAHKLGITHRDIKPDNILITTQPDGGDLVKVSDFGIAKSREFTFGTKTGVMVGTPEYMAPEQVMRKHGEEVDGRADLYSLAIVLYEMLTGRLPFESDTPLGMAFSRLQSEPVPPRQIRPELEIPQALSDVLMKALQRDRANRFQTASGLIAALQGASVSAGTEAKTVLEPVVEVKPESDFGASADVSNERSSGRAERPARPAATEAIPTAYEAAMARIAHDPRFSPQPPKPEVPERTPAPPAPQLVPPTPQPVAPAPKLASPGPKKLRRYKLARGLSLVVLIIAILAGVGLLVQSSSLRSDKAETQSRIDSYQTSADVPAYLFVRVNQLEQQQKVENWGLFICVVVFIISLAMYKSSGEMIDQHRSP